MVESNDPDTQRIILDEATAKKWSTFCKYEPILNTMIDAGVFQARNAQVTMNFNSMGDLMNIEMTIKAYQRRRVT